MLHKYFSDINDQIPFEGRESKNPFAFKYYDKNQKVGAKTMGEHLRFSVAFWHTLKGGGGGYGLDTITRIGRDIENAAQEKRTESIKAYIDELSDYLERVEVVYD